MISFITHSIYLIKRHNLESLSYTYPSRERSYLFKKKKNKSMRHLLLISIIETTKNIKNKYKIVVRELMCCFFF